MKTKLARILSIVFAPLFVMAIVLGAGIMFQTKSQEIAQTPEVEQNQKPYDWSEALASGFSASADGIYDVATAENVLIDLSDDVAPGSDTDATLTRTTLDGEPIPTNMLTAKMVGSNIEIVIRANEQDHYITASTDAEYVLGDLLTGGRQVLARGTKFYVANEKGTSALARTSLDGTGTAQTTAVSHSDAQILYMTSGVIVFDGKNGTYNAVGEGRAIFVSGATSFTLKNVILNAFKANASGIIYSYGTNTAFDNIHVNNSRAQVAFYIDGGSTGTKTTSVTNSTFAGNAHYFHDDTTWYCAPTLSFSNHSTVTITNCIIGDANFNSVPELTSFANMGGLSVGGGAQTINITDCTFGGNYNQGGGAIDCNNANATINATNCNFLYNRSKYEGGAIKHFNGNINVNGATFVGNYSSRGGALYCNQNGVGSVTIKNANIHDNIAHGAICNDFSKTIVTIENCYIQDNASTVGNYAIYNQGITILKNCDISNSGLTQNTSTIGNGNGRATLVASNADIQPTAKASNVKKPWSGSSIYYSQMEFVIKNNGYFVEGNKYAIFLTYLNANNPHYVDLTKGFGTGVTTFSFYGGATTSGTATRYRGNKIEWIEFVAAPNTNQHIISLAWLGDYDKIPDLSDEFMRSIHVDIFDITNGMPAVMTIDGGYIHENNYSQSTSCHGGAINNFNYGVLNLMGGVVFDSNTAGGQGGCITSYSNAVVDINGATFDTNSANYGGAISSNSKVWINNVDVLDGSATSGGGFLHAYGSGKTTIVSGSFHNNSAPNGGVIYGSGNIDIYGGNFYGNHATTGTSGVINGNGATSVINFYGGHFYGNDAATQGGVIELSGTLNIYDGAVLGDSEQTTAATADYHSNIANYGGAVSPVSGATVNVFGGVIAYNYARNSGGFVASYWDNTTINISGGTIKYNGANGNAASVIFAYSVVHISGGQIINNGTARGGNAIELRAANNTITGGTIADNIGGAIQINKANNINSSLSMSGGTISGNDSATYGGGVFVGENTTFTMSGGTISGNSAELAGGGIYNRSGGTLTLSESANITGNTAGNTGGGIYAKGTTTISGGTISGNTATNGGGIYLLGSSSTTIILSISGGTISGNTATVSGGGVYCTGTFNMSGGTIGDASANEASDVINQIGSNSAGESGGGVYLSGATSVFTLTGGIIAYNFASTEGGGGVAMCSGGTMYMHGGEVRYNSSNTNNIVFNGAGVRVDNSTMYFDGGMIHGNDNLSRGGGLLVRQSSFYMSSVNGSNPQIINNTASYGGGIYVLHSKSPNKIVSISGGTISGNTATNNGGGIFADYGNVSEISISGGTISNNTASSGGGVFWEGLLNITGGTFSGNSSSTGAGIYSRGTLNISDGTFSSNTASYGGGAIFYYNSSGTCSITGGTFSNNSATNGGGAIYLNYGSLAISDTIENGEVVASPVFSGNTARYGGGFFLYRDNSIIIDGGIISNNTATSNGGVIYVNSTATISMVSGTITGNTAQNGGAFYLNVATATLNITGGTISNNTAIQTETLGDGGAIYSNNSGVVNISGGTFSGNTAVRYGAVLCGTGTTTISETIEDGEVVATPVFYQNTGSNIIYHNGGTLNISGGVIGDATWNTTPTENNNANKGTAIRTSGANVTITGGVVKGTYGGGVHCDGSTGTVAISDFVSAYNSGVGIQIGRPFTMTTTLVDHNADKGMIAASNGTISNSTYSNNEKVNSSGSGLIINYVTVSVTNCSFVNNGKSSSGYAAALHTYGTTTINNCTFTGNGNGNIYGGAIVIFSGTTTIGGGTVIGDANWNTRPTSSNCSNFARVGASVYVYGNSCVLNLNDCIIAGNYAHNGGSGVMLDNGTNQVCNINGATIKYCASGATGSGLYVNSNVTTATIANSSITNCYATGKGGGIYFNTTSSIDGCTITNNTAVQDGGGIYVGASGNLTISDCTISDNSAYNGGGIYAAGTLTIEDTTENGTVVASPVIVRNTATGQGGGGVAVVGSSAVLNMTGGTIGGSAANANTAAQAGGGIACQNGATLNISGGNITYNSAPIGGGIYSATAEDIINLSGNANISYNAATYYSAGGIYATGILTMTGGTVSHNTANNATNGYAGGIMLKNVDNTITGGEISYNACAKDGGGIKADGNNGGTKTTITISGSATITHNTAGGNGGGIAVNTNASLIVDSNASITYNTATRTDDNSGYGGGIYSYGDPSSSINSIWIKNGLVDHNTAYSGGGIYLCYTGLLQIWGGSITNNQATANGGGIRVYGGLIYNSMSWISMRGGTITDNAADYGGGISIESGYMAMSSGVIGDASANSVATADSHGNFARGNGGGISLNKSRLYFSGGNIRYNIGAAGGGIYSDHATDVINISNGTIDYNCASSTHGGGIYTLGTLDMSAGTIASNVSTSSGGGIFISGGTLTMTGGCIGKSDAGAVATASAYSNYAGGNGGGIRADNTTLNLSGGSIKYNCSANTGGGIRAGNEGDDGTIYLYGTTISYNYASASSGGGIYAYAILDMRGGTISYNKANTYGGGAILKTTKYDGNRIYAGTISNNVTERYDGGGLRLDGSLIISGAANITGNTAARHGGGISTTARFNVEDSQFNLSGNTAGGNGGGLHSTHTSSGFFDGSVVYGTIDDNSVGTSSGLGSAIYCENGFMCLSGTSPLHVSGSGNSIGGLVYCASTAVIYLWGGVYNTTVLSTYFAMSNDTDANHGYILDTWGGNGPECGTGGRTFRLSEYSYIKLLCSNINYGTFYSIYKTNLSKGSIIAYYSGSSSSVLNSFKNCIGSVNGHSTMSGSTYFAIRTIATGEYALIWNSNFTLTALDDKGVASLLSVVPALDVDVSMPSEQTQRQEAHAETAWFDDKHRKLSRAGAQIVTADGPVDGLIV